LSIQAKNQSSKLSCYSAPLKDERNLPGNELVAVGEPGHEAALLEPEDGGKAAGEEDALHGGEGNDALRVGGVLGADPLDGPVGLPLHGGHRLHRVEQLVPLCRVPEQSPIVLDLGTYYPP